MILPKYYLQLIHLHYLIYPFEKELIIMKFNYLENTTIKVRQGLVKAFLSIPMGKNSLFDSPSLCPQRSQQPQQVPISPVTVPITAPSPLTSQAARLPIATALPKTEPHSRPIPLLAIAPIKLQILPQATTTFIFKTLTVAQ